MSALTFDTLSAELTQALAEQSDTPPETTARCTLGREKVMVLVEYPLDSAKAEPRASETLDWLEQHLRDQFDTTGLPEEVADISDSIDEVAVQLYLKHLSEAKPFTMRSFTWKVDDGFDALFGDASVDEAELEDSETASSELAVELNGNGVSVAELADTLPMDVASTAPTDTPQKEAIPEDSKLAKELVFEEILSGKMNEPPALISLPDGEEDLVLSELEADHLPLDAEPEMDLTLALEDNDDAGSAHGLEQGFGLGANQGSSLELGLELSQGLEGSLDEAFVPIPSEPISTSADLEADLSVGVDAPAVIIPETPEELSLPGEAPTLSSSELDLPTVELPVATSAASSPAASDFFDLADELPAVTASSSVSSLPEVDFSSAFAATEGRSFVSNTDNIDLFDVTTPDNHEIQLENATFDTAGNNDNNSLGIFAFEDNSPEHAASTEEEQAENEQAENEHLHSENGHHLGADQPEQADLDSFLELEEDTQPDDGSDAESSIESESPDLEELLLFNAEDSSETTDDVSNLDETELPLDELVSSHEDLAGAPVSDDFSSPEHLSIDELFVSDSVVKDRVEGPVEAFGEEGATAEVATDAIEEITAEENFVEEAHAETSEEERALEELKEELGEETLTELLEDEPDVASQLEAEDELLTDDFAAETPSDEQIEQLNEQTEENTVSEVPTDISVAPDSIDAEILDKIEEIDTEDTLLEAASCEASSDDRGIDIEAASAEVIATEEETLLEDDLSDALDMSALAAGYGLTNFGEDGFEGEEDDFSIAAVGDASGDDFMLEIDPLPDLSDEVDVESNASHAPVDSPYSDTDGDSADYASVDYTGADYAGEDYAGEDYADEGYTGEGYTGEDYAGEDYDNVDGLPSANDDRDYDDGSDYYLEDVEADGEEDELYEEVGVIDEGEVQRQREQWQQQSQGNPWLFVGTFGLLVAGILGFVLSRPCVFGRCDRIQTAQIQGDEALGKLRTDNTLEAVNESKQQLQGSIRLLDPIPVWSPYYGQAQAILPEYERQIESLDLVTEAQGKAYGAAVKSQDPPHSESTWKEIADEWRESTTLLAAVPADSPVRELAETKLVEYRANLSTILVRIETESDAEAALIQAQQAASRATKRVDVASSLEDWEAALADWDQAVGNLRQIPQGTKAYAEAQQLLPEYDEQYQSVRERTEIERSGDRTLSSAKQLAASAQRAETDDQWTVAVDSWKSAISQLQAVPTKSIAHSEVEALLKRYATALRNSEESQQVAFNFQPIEPGFYLVCGITADQKCTYSVQGKSVRVDLFQGYDVVIDQSITPPSQRQEIVSEAEYIDQSNQLLQQLTLLSTQAQIPVELYSAEGNFMARYRPDLDGFVREQDT
ncbi:MAG: hypothetical protein AAFQ40_01260 [Cyanobacteria bacterium J06623_5]